VDTDKYPVSISGIRKLQSSFRARENPSLHLGEKKTPIFIIKFFRENMSLCLGEEKTSIFIIKFFGKTPLGEKKNQLLLLHSSTCKM
jgi:hypothetical protein